ncbi:ABC transporter permease [Paraflavitalea pollutisoli]|uniref:ABC transporter permease n=1 Tax=Paraflavitalea pollutisoli TaxID=3034143 RepID=UPI0023EC7331|nr:ABC transporter permease [Paraflavitalea sp. H1-2-19X]
MLLHHLRFAWRNILKDRRFTLLNLIGLASGLACALLICLWISDEMGMDKGHREDARLYQVMQNIESPHGVSTMDYTSGLLAGTLAETLTEVEYAATVLPASWFSSKGIIAQHESKLKARGQFVSKDYFKLFTGRFLAGNPDQLFADKRYIAVSDELAMKLFHTTDVLGKTIEWNQNEFNGTYTIQGVFEKNAPQVSDPFDVLFSFDLFIEKRPHIMEWGNSDPNTYVLLKPGTDIDRFNTHIHAMLLDKDKNEKKTLFVRKFSDKYLYSQYTNGKQSGGRISYVKLFALIGIFILLIACVNFMNLSTARAASRMKEVGVKKVVGASRSSLVLQYLSESVLMSTMALLLALALMALLLPAFNTITGKSLTLHLSSSMFMAVASITLLTGLVAGAYPALYLSRFRPVAVLKGKLSTKAGELWIRKGLVVFQFSLSVMAIVAVLVIAAQINYIQSKDLGYHRDNVVSFPIPLDEEPGSMTNGVTFINNLRNIPGVLSVSSYYHNLTGDHGGIGRFQWPGKDPANNIEFANLEVGQGYMETMGMQLVAGRDFSSNASAEREIIFNEEAIRKMGIKDPIGKMVKFWDREKRIVGIAKDFHFESLYANIQPAFFQVYPAMPNIIVKVKAGTEKQTLAAIQRVFTGFYKGLDFEYRFLDEEYQSMYAAENRVATLSKYFTGLILLIACLGLFGLAAFTAQKRQKEIGIRKVVGASVNSIIVLLSKEYLVLILIAALIALPLVGWGMHQWLQAFAYRVSIAPWIFLVAGGTVLLITLLTVSFQSIKAALANPVRSLRSE